MLSVSHVDRVISTTSCCTARDHPPTPPADKNAFRVNENAPATAATNPSAKATPNTGANPGSNTTLPRAASTPTKTAYTQQASGK